MKAKEVQSYYTPRKKLCDLTQDTLNNNNLHISHVNM